MSVDFAMPERPVLSTGDACDAPDPRIAHVEERLCMLRELAELGMELTRALVREAAAPSQSPEEPPAPPTVPRRDPADAFARLSRAVRLTLALEAKTDGDLAALRARPSGSGSEPPPAPVRGPIPGVNLHPQGWRDDFAPEGVELTPYNSRPLPRDYPSAFRNQVRDSVLQAIDHEVDDIRRATAMLDDLYERLWEGDRYDAFIHRPLRGVVAAICQDLGLQVDWSRWTDDGWPPRPKSGGYRWEMLWQPRGSLIPKPRLYRPPKPPPRGGDPP